MGGQAEGLPCADPGARTPIVASGIDQTFHQTSHTKPLTQPLTHTTSYYHKTSQASSRQVFAHPTLKLKNYPTSPIDHQLPIHPLTILQFKHYTRTHTNQLLTLSITQTLTKYFQNLSYKLSTNLSSSHPTSFQSVFQLSHNPPTYILINSSDII